MIEVVVLASWLVILACSDIFKRKLPNYLTLGAIFVAVLTLVLFGNSLLGASISSCLVALTCALILTLPAYIVRWLGAGDVKMLSALALMTGLEFMLLSYAVAGILAGIIVLYSVIGQRYLPYLNLYLTKLGLQLPIATVIKGRALPFGALMAFGGLLMLALHLTGIVNVVAVA